MGVLGNTTIDTVSLMAMVMTLFLALGGFIFFKSKIYFGIQSVWIIIIMSFNTYSVDWSSIEPLFEDTNKYNIFREGFFMSGYYYCSYLAKSLGMSFVTFNGIMVASATFLICIIIYKYSKNPCIALSFFYFFPFIDSVIQKKWYIAMALLIAGLPVLWRKGYKMVNAGVFLLIVLFACMFHTSSIFFITLVGLYIVPEKIRKYIVIMVFILMNSLGSVFTGLVSKIQNNSIEGKSEVFFYKIAENSMSHYLFWCLWHLLFLMVIYVLLNKYKKRGEIDESFAKFLKLINLWSICIIPLYKFDPVFARLFRVVIIYNYIAISNIFYINRLKIEKNRLLIIAFQIAICVISFVTFDVLAGISFNELVLPIFQNNEILNLFRH